jgi:hypothetical protein
MAEFLASGHLVDLILIALEAVVLVAYWRQTKRGISPSEFLPGFGSADAARLARNACRRRMGLVLRGPGGCGIGAS